eukprot:scaffold8374_cov175-Amphora_coffeaeformis.AAC.88
MIVKIRSSTQGRMRLRLLAVFLVLMSIVRLMHGFLLPTSTDSGAVRSCQRQGQRRNTSTRRWISSGLTFEDGNQILVSVQKPLGIILEQDTEESFIRIADVDPAGSGALAGLRVNDILVAVQNADMVERDLEYAMQFITQAPKVLNLRFVRIPQDAVGDS